MTLTGMHRHLARRLFLLPLVGLPLACAPEAPKAEVEPAAHVATEPASSGATVEVLDLPVEPGGYRLAETQRYSVQVFAPDAVIESHLVHVGPKNTPLVTLVVRDGDRTLTFGWDDAAQSFRLDGAARALGTYAWRDGELTFVAAREGVGPSGVELPFGPSLPIPKGEAIDPHAGHDHDD